MTYFDDSDKVQAGVSLDGGGNGLKAPRKARTRAADGSPYALRASRCKHVREDGSRCKCSRLKGEDFCFYHVDGGRRAIEAGRRGNLVSRQRAGEAVDLAVKNPRTVQEMTAALTLIVNSVMVGALTPAQARESTAALQAIARIRESEAVLDELRRLNDKLDGADGKGDALLAALDSIGQRT